MARAEHTSRDDLDAALRRVPRLRRLFDPARDTKQPVIVTGDPTKWKAAAEQLRVAGCKVQGFHDIMSVFTADRFEGQPVLRGRVWKNPNSTVVFAGKPAKDWFNPNHPGFDACLWLTEPRDWQQSGRHTPKLLERHADALCASHDLLADEPSRALFYAILRARVEGDAGYYSIAPYREYDHPVVHARPGDVVIDGGAYHGQTSRMYAEQVQRTGRVFALEPSHAAYMQLAEACSGLPQVVPLCVAVSGAAGVLNFVDRRGTSSKVAAGGASRALAISIDSLVSQLKLRKLDLIKLDVEGAEAEAIDGMQGALKRLRPSLQISIYHRFEDLYELPLKLARMLRGYRFYLGHHSYYQMETDLYAIPIERWLEHRLCGLPQRIRKQLRR